MPRMEQAEVERLAIEFAAKNIRTPHELEGSAYREGGEHEYDDVHYWNVFFCSCVCPLEIGISSDFVIHVDDWTGTVSYTPGL